MIRIFFSIPTRDLSISSSISFYFSNFLFTFLAALPFILFFFRFFFISPSLLKIFPPPLLYDFPSLLQVYRHFEEFSLPLSVPLHISLVFFQYVASRNHVIPPILRSIFSILSKQVSVLHEKILPFLRIINIKTRPRFSLSEEAFNSFATTTLNSVWYTAFDSSFNYVFRFTQSI